MLKKYEESLEFLRKDTSGKSFFSGNKTDALLGEAEKVLGIQFSQMYRMFLSEFGAGSFGAAEFLGIIDGDFEESCVPDGIWYTLNEREKSNLPNDFLVIYEVGDGNLFCLDYRNVENGTEPTVVLFSPGISIENQTFDIVSQNYGEFFTERLNREI